MSGLAAALGKGDRVVDITSAFDSKEDESSAIEEVSLRLKTLEKDPAALAEAKRIAENGYKAFIDYMGGGKPLVSVVVPNYNHAPYLKERIDSILSQSYKNIDLIILDDCSKDDSMDIIRLYEDRARIVVNKENSGSPFRQWMKGIEMAKGSFVWIAESDDSSDPLFLEKAVEAMTSSGSVLAFSSSNEIDSEGHAIGIQSYQRYMQEDFSMDGK